MANRIRFENYYKSRVKKAQGRHEGMGGGEKRNSLLYQVMKEAEHSKPQRMLAELIMKYDLNIDREKAKEHYS